MCCSARRHARDNEISRYTGARVLSVMGILRQQRAGSSFRVAHNPLEVASGTDLFNWGDTASGRRWEEGRSDAEFCEIAERFDG
jgi:hypothetical protein